MGEDDLARRVKSAVDVDGADERLHHIAQHRLHLVDTGLFFGVANLDEVMQADGLAHRGTDVTAHDGTVAGSELALLLFPVVVEELVGDDQREHPVAQKLQPFVILGLAARRTMGQRLLQKLRIREDVANPVTETAERCP